MASLIGSRRGEEQNNCIQVLDLTNTINELNEFLKRLIGEKITLEVSHDSDLWPVRVDQTQLEQVIVNLVVNARDAILDGGNITVRTRNIWSQEAETFAYRGMPAADYVQIEVADSGTGMPPEVVDKIFEPFFSTKELGKGTGLGLSTVYGIIKQSEGYICAFSEVDKGTTFQIYLPALKAEDIPDIDPVSASDVLESLLHSLNNREDNKHDE